MSLAVDPRLSPEPIFVSFYDDDMSSFLIRLYSYSLVSTLVISSSQQADFTEYTCRIENSYGEDNAAMLLIMQGETRE